MSVHILTGFGDIANPDNIKPGINVKDLERQYIAGGIIQKQKDPQDKFKDEMQETARKLGINFGEVGGKPSSSSSAPSKPPQPKLPSIGIDSNQRARSPMYNSSQDDDPEDAGSDGSVSGDESDHEGGDEPEKDEDTSPEDPGDKGSDDEAPAARPTWDRSWLDGNKRGGDLTSKTAEQERRAHITSVMGEMGANGGFSFEKEKKEDEKCRMLEEIDSLKYTLQEEDVDLTRVPDVGPKSSYEEVDAVLKMLRHKNDRNRYCSFAEEFLLFGAYGLEELFNGKNTWFGRYQPDLTGWHNHVNVKLRRMRHDTSTLVSSIMQDYNIGPGFRILLELIPNMVLYSKMRKQQHNQPTLYSDEEIAQAQNRIRDL